MNWNAVGALAEVAGVFLVIVSLFFVGQQIRIGNRLGVAEGERAWLTKWHELVQAPFRSKESSDAFRTALLNYDQIGKSERAVFSGYLVALLDHAQAAQRMNVNGFLSDDLLQKITDACIAWLKTPGGNQWWSDVGPAMGIHEYMESIPWDHVPAFSESVSFLKPD